MSTPDRSKISNEASITVTLEQLGERLRPPGVPADARIIRFASCSVEAGDQREPYMAGVKLVWRWQEGGREHG